MTQPKIVIVGAGPAGLTLARLLQRNHIECTVYEGEPDRTSRNQGGCLDLHEKAGQLALKKAGLLQEFEKLSRPEGDCRKILDGAGRVLIDENVTGVARLAEDSNRPEIDRTLLRDLLLDSLEAGTVQWGQKIASVETESTGIHTIHFENGPKQTGIDLLVGADGAFSKVRPLVTDAQPYYSGITMLELWKLNVDEENPWLSQYIGAGSCFMFDQDRALLSQRQGNNAVRAYAGVRQPLSWSQECGIDWDDPSAARKAMAEYYFGDCGQDIKRTILEADDNLVLRHLYMLPVGLKWESRPGVTLLGDAAHLMTPFAGVGVNAAMLDALDLATAVIGALPLKDSTSIAAAVHHYEQAMFPRAEYYSKRTYNGLEHHFRATGAQEWAERFKDSAEKYRQQCSDK